MTRARHTCLSRTAGTSTTRRVSVTRGDSLFWASPEFRWLISVRSLRSVVNTKEYVQWILKRLRVRKYGAGGLHKTEAQRLS
jgi:hypothetical protein